MGGSARRWLRERVARLDDPGPSPWEHVVEVMSGYTNTALDGTPADLVLDPAEADAVVAGSALLAALARERPDVVSGPLDRADQTWVSTGRHPAHRPDPRLVTPPGLWTSTATAAGGPGSWELYLEPYAGSDPFPYPWTAWRLPVRPGAVVAEVRSAADWVRLVERCGHRRDGLLRPDPSLIAAAGYDGVHIGLAAVVAAQSWYLRTGDGDLVAPSYWDVESSFWPAWAFEPPELLAVTDEKGRNDSP